MKSSKKLIKNEVKLIIIYDYINGGCNKQSTFDDLNLKDNLLRGTFAYGFENHQRFNHQHLPPMKHDAIARLNRNWNGGYYNFCRIVYILQKLDKKFKSNSNINYLFRTHGL